MNSRSRRPLPDACTSTSSYPMPVTTGSTTFSRLKQKIGPKPISLKLLKYNRIFQFTPAARRKIGRQLERPVTHAYQAAHGMPDRLKKAAHFAVAAFLEHHPVPVVASLPLALQAHPVKAGRGPVQRHAFQKAIGFFPREDATDARPVLPLDF